MSQAARTPTAYRPNLRTRIMEGLRYGGGIGQWSWLVHRVTGLGIVFFLIIHIVDTFFVVAYPALYDHTVSIYGGVFNGTYFWPLRWAFRIGELGLIACVLFHAINGWRIIVMDFRPAAARHQKALAWAVVAVFGVLMLLISIAVFLPLLQSPEHWHIPESEPSAVVTR